MTWRLSRTRSELFSSRPPGRRRGRFKFSANDFQIQHQGFATRSAIRLSNSVNFSSSNQWFPNPLANTDHECFHQLSIVGRRTAWSLPRPPAAAMSPRAMAPPAGQWTPCSGTVSTPFALPGQLCRRQSRRDFCHADRQCSHCGAGRPCLHGGGGAQVWLISGSLHRRSLGDSSESRPRGKPSSVGSPPRRPLIQKRDRCSRAGPGNGGRLQLLRLRPSGARKRSGRRSRTLVARRPAHSPFESPFIEGTAPSPAWRCALHGPAWRHDGDASRRSVTRTPSSPARRCAPRPDHLRPGPL